MKTIWKRIDSWLNNNAPDIAKDLAKGASDAEIKRLEKSININLPNDVKESYIIHNGQLGNAAPLMVEWELYSTEYSVKHWFVLKELLDAGEFENASLKSTEGVKPVWWNLKWLPISGNGAGDHYCVDLDPAKGGKTGQIIVFRHTAPERVRLAKSWMELLERFAADLEKSRYRVEDGALLHTAAGSK